MTAAKAKAARVAFGIELEVFMPAEHAFEVGSYHHGRQVRSIDYWTARGWTAERDGSVYSDSPEYGCLEIVSPKLSGEAGLTEVVCMLEWLAEIGSVMGPQCGQHVSVDARNLTAEQLLSIDRTYVRLEAGMFLFNGPEAGNRWQNVYCRPLSVTRRTDRYSALNNVPALSGPADRRRLEFRMWAGTLTTTTTLGYILASVGLVTAIASGEDFGEIPTDAYGQFRAVVKHAVLAYRIVKVSPEAGLVEILRPVVQAAREAGPGLDQVRGLLMAVA